MNKYTIIQKQVHKFNKHLLWNIKASNQGALYNFN